MSMLQWSILNFSCNLTQYCKKNSSIDSERVEPYVCHVYMSCVSIFSFIHTHMHNAVTLVWGSLGYRTLGYRTLSCRTLSYRTHWLQDNRKRLEDPRKELQVPQKQLQKTVSLQLDGPQQAPLHKLQLWWHLWALLHSLPALWCPQVLTTPAFTPVRTTISPVSGVQSGTGTIAHPSQLPPITPM